MKYILFVLLLLSSIGLYKRAEPQKTTVDDLVTADNGTYVVNAEVFTENGFSNISGDSTAITAVGCRGTCLGYGTVTINKTGAQFQVIKFVPFNKSSDEMLRVVETRATPFGPRARVEAPNGKTYWVRITGNGGVLYRDK